MHAHRAYAGMLNKLFPDSSGLWRSAGGSFLPAIGDRKSFAACNPGFQWRMHCENLKRKNLWNEWLRFRLYLSLNILVPKLPLKAAKMCSA